MNHKKMCANGTNFPSEDRKRVKMDILFRKKILKMSTFSKKTFKMGSGFESQVAHLRLEQIRVPLPPQKNKQTNKTKTLFRSKSTYSEERQQCLNCHDCDWTFR